MWKFRGIYISWIFMEIYLKQISRGAYGSLNCTHFYDTWNLHRCCIYSMDMQYAWVHHSFNEVNKRWSGMLSPSGWTVFPIFLSWILTFPFAISCDDIGWIWICSIRRDRYFWKSKNYSDHDTNKRTSSNSAVADLWIHRKVEHVAIPSGPVHAY